MRPGPLLLCDHGRVNDADLIASVDDLKDYMSGLSLEVDQEAALEDVLAGCQRQLERYCQRQFVRKVRTEVVIPDDDGRLWLKASPVVSVSSPTGYTLLPGRGGLGHAGFGWGGGPFGDPYAPVSVTYIGGLDPDDDDLEDVKLAVLRVAAREATTRHDDVLDPRDLEARRVEPSDRRPFLGFTKDELEQFDRLRRRTVA